MVLKGVVLTKETADPAYLTPHPLLHGKTLSGSDLHQLCRGHANHSESFIDGAINRGDWCYIFRDGSEVASYGWYTAKPRPITEHIDIHFSSEYMYMYRGFTADNYRGQRLHGYGMGHALTESVEQGYEGLISCIEADNEPSLKSSFRLGYRSFGSCILFRVFSRDFVFRTPGCRQYGFYLAETQSRMDTEEVAGDVASV